LEVREVAGQADHTETEIKLRTAGPGAARLMLERIGAERKLERHFEDNLLLDDAGSSLAKSGGILRLRRVGARGVLTHKGERQVVDGVKARKEVEVDVLDPDALLEILETVGLRPVFRYQKYREVYAWQDVEIVIDETPVGTFMEIEGRVDSIHRAAEALGCRREDYIVDSYVALFFAAGGRGDMVFK
jgi:adenylate cyclase class 2